MCCAHLAELPSTSCRTVVNESEESSSHIHQAGGGTAQVSMHISTLHAQTWVLQVCLSAPAAQHVPSEGCGPTPPEVRANQLAATVDNYRQQAIANGLPFR